MTEKQFRSAVNGFNRKDVVLYIEQINNEYNNALNQLRSENQSLREALACPDVQDAAQKDETLPKQEVERLAKERMQELYQMAVEALDEATARVDAAAENFRTIADSLNGQGSELQAALDSSKNALMDAATVLYTLHLPEEE